MGFIEQCYENLRKVRRDEIENIYESLYPEVECGIYIDGEIGGRSLQGAKIGAYELASLPEKIRIYGAGDSFTPGKNIVHSFTNLEKVCEKVNYLAVSGSGKSATPNKNLRELTEKYNSNKLILNLITSNPESPMGEIIQKHEGNILKLSGRKSKNTSNSQYIADGLLEDGFELATTELVSTISKGILKDIDPEEFYEFYRDKIKELHEIETAINNLKNTPEYQEFLECLSDPIKSLFSCGQGVSNDVVKMNNIRVGHVRPLTLKKLGIEPNSNLVIGANRNFVIGESNTPNMDGNSVLLCVSQSGTGIIEKYLDDAKKVGAECFLLTKYGEIDGANIFRLEIDNFYTGACFFLSSALMDLGRYLVNEGIEINEKVLRDLHINDKIS